MNITLRPEETTMGTRTLFYLRPGAGKYNGKLTVANRAIGGRRPFDCGALNIDKCAGAIQAR